MQKPPEWGTFRKKKKNEDPLLRGTGSKIFSRRGCLGDTRSGSLAVSYEKAHIPPANIGVLCSFLLLFFSSFQFDFLSLSFVGFLPSVKWWKFLMWLGPWDLFPKW